MTSIRLAPKTSLTSLIERSCPTASGVIVSGKVTVSRSGRTGSASGSGSLARIASSASRGDSTTSRTGAALHQPRTSAGVPPAISRTRYSRARSAPGASSRSGRAAAGRFAECRPRSWPCPLGVDVDLELDDAAERAGGNLDLLVDTAFGLLHRPLANDRQLPPADLDADLTQVDPGEVDFDHRPLRIAAVVDVDIGREAAGAAADVGGTAPGVPHHLVHLPPHAGEIRKQIALRHAQNIARGSVGG